MVLSGNSSVSNFSTSSSFRIRKSIGRGYSSRSSQVFGLPSSTHPPLSTLLVFVRLLGYSYIHPPLSPPPRLAPYCFPPAVNLSVAIQKPASVTPVLLAVGNEVLAHPPATPHQSLAILIPSCHRALLYSPAPLLRAGPYSHFLAQADTRHLSDVIFLCQGFIHFFCSPSWFLQMSLKVLLSFLLVSFRSTSFVCTSMFVGFGWGKGEMCGWSHTRGACGFGCFLW